ncbi:MAG: hypothetical protein JJU29_01120 [Verrucomicrobia bacterium]|nr:hypothetical protein [Verrucomicrobiota bacterium]MCH8510492.1 hypothetical protein [Kiritimatiellia bacterium]
MIQAKNSSAPVGWLRGLGEISAYGGISKRTVQRWIVSGKLKVKYLSQKKIVCRPQEVDKCIEAVSQDFEVRNA